MIYYFITYRARGINTTIMKQMDGYFKGYANMLIPADRLNIFKDIFEECLKNHSGRGKAPICRSWGIGLIDRELELDDIIGGVNIYIDNTSDTPKSAIQLGFTIVKGIVSETGEIGNFMNNEAPPVEVRRCRICGCTDDDCHQCIEKTGEPCHWVEDDLCSACAEETPTV
jgi:hypothetical protein